MPASRVLHDAREAIHVLGGPVQVAELCGVGRNAVSNWYRRGFPPEHHDLLATRLRKAGYVFSPRLFKQTVEAPKPPSPYPKQRPRKNGGNPPPTRRTGQ